MRYDPKRRDSSWQMIQPGCYIDPAGFGHLFPDEILAFLKTVYPHAGFDPADKNDYDLVVHTFREQLQKQFPGIEFLTVMITHERSMD